MSNYILFHSLWCNMIIVLFVKTEADEDNTMKTEQRKNNTMRTGQRKNNTMESLETEEVS